MRLLKSGVIYFVLICVGLPLLYRFYVISGKLQQPSFSMYGTKPQPETQGNRVKACFVVLIRNTELDDWRTSMLQLEDRFNKHHNYPYVFLNNELFTDEFKKSVKALTKAKIDFGLVPNEHWSYPAFIDQAKAKHSREQMNRDGVIYGDKESYHHMCRFESGFFFLHNLTLEYDYYWRVEPGVSFLCDITRDPFLFMQKNNMKYGFTISLYEYLNTIPTLWLTVNKWIDERNLRGNFPKDNALKFISDDGGRTYNLCHFWTNFEIASFDLWRAKQYRDFFHYLDKTGGFFYERWGDAPVHSIYAALTLPKDQIHFFDEIGYTHPPFSHCPVLSNPNCICDPKENFDNHPYSCNLNWLRLKY